MYIQSYTIQMSIIDLPVELHRNIRSYGYYPIIDDETIYKMIRELNPSFSLMSIYDRIVRWKLDMIG